MTPSVHVRGLTKSYGSFQAVKGVDFEIFPGEVFGLLGPNGAGKTTTVEILEGLRPRNAGDVSVLGFDPGRETRRVKDRIGVCLQATNLPDRITVREAMRLFASLYSRTVDADTLLKRLMLWDKRDQGYGKLSGGQKQRLALALALINDPQMLFSRRAVGGTRSARAARDPRGRAGAAPLAADHPVDDALHRERQLSPSRFPP
jgi:ABC-2 type transport system ATP-binding protein